MRKKHQWRFSAWRVIPAVLRNVLKPGHWHLQSLASAIGFISTWNKTLKTIKRLSQRANLFLKKHWRLRTDGKNLL